MSEYGLKSEYRVERDKNGIMWKIENCGDGIGISFAEENRDFNIVEIPEQLGGKPVLALLDKAFYKNSFIKEIRIPDMVQRIGEEAFYHCDSLKKVTLSGNIRKIPKWCFSYCRELQEVNGLEHILFFEAYSFYMGLAVSELFLEQEIEYIGYYAFSECEIKKLYIGNIIQAGKMSFARCNCLREVYFSDAAKAVPAYCFFQCKNLQYLSLNLVTAIGNHAFGRCSSLKKLKLPASLTKIGKDILFENQMELVIIPEKYENMTYGGKVAKYIIRPTVSIVLNYNESKWKKETRVIYHGESMVSLPMLETTCKEMIGWYENPIQEQLSDEFLEFLVLKFGIWVKKLYETTLQPYNFEKPVYSDLLLYAKWRIKGDETEGLSETKKLCD